MEGLLEVISADELYKRGNVSSEEIASDFMFMDKTVMRFRNFESAVSFGRGFVMDYLIPKYGIEEAIKFPIIQSEPERVLESADMIAEYLGLTQERSKEMWLLIPSDRYNEVQTYLDTLKNQTN